MPNESVEKLVVPGVRGLMPYQPGKPVAELQRELGLERVIKLASNENPLGPGSNALEIIRSELDELARYPDGSGFQLKQALAEKLAVKVDQITLGNGSNDILELVARTFLMPGREAVFSRHCFAIYPIVTQAVGAVSRVAPTLTENYGHDLVAMAGLVGEKTSVVFLANPNNPTGTFLNSETLRWFISSLPSHVVVVVDEAYFEYVEEEDYPDCLQWLETFPRLIVTRTFSKAYGLAGLRVGYSVCSAEIAEMLNRVRQPFNVNSLALSAAEAALSDQQHLDHSKQVNRAGLGQLANGFDRLEREYIPSAGNFICVNVGRDAESVYSGLLEKGVIVRPVANYDMPEHLRVTVGRADENAIFLHALEHVLAHV